MAEGSSLGKDLSGFHNSKHSRIYYNLFLPLQVHKCKSEMITSQVNFIKINQFTACEFCLKPWKIDGIVKCIFHVIPLYHYLEN